MDRRGISPVIATVLLIAMVISIGLIIFLWFRGMTQESITKFDENVELVCGKVEINAEYSGGVLSISNNGNVPIYGIKIKATGEGSHDTFDLPGFEGLASKETFSRDISTDIGSAEEITLVPVLLGSSDKGDQTYVCDEAQFGYELVVY